MVQPTTADLGLIFRIAWKRVWIELLSQHATQTFHGHAPRIVLEQWGITFSICRVLHHQNLRGLGHSSFPNHAGISNGPTTLKIFLVTNQESTHNCPWDASAYQPVHRCQNLHDKETWGQQEAADGANSRNNLGAICGTTSNKARSAWAIASDLPCPWIPLALKSFFRLGRKDSCENPTYWKLLIRIGLNIAGFTKTTAKIRRTVGISRTKSRSWSEEGISSATSRSQEKHLHILVVELRSKSMSSSVDRPPEATAWRDERPMPAVW